MMSSIDPNLYWGVIGISVTLVFYGLDKILETLKIMKLKSRITFWFKFVLGLSMFMTGLFLIIILLNTLYG